MAERAGYFSDLERVVPEMRDESPGEVDIGGNQPGDTKATAGREAKMDIVIHGATEEFKWCIDVTVRHPTAARYRVDSARASGHTATTACREKRRRYPPAGGRHVTPLAWETWGRTSPEVHELLFELAASACGRRRAGGSARMAGRWLAEFDAILHVWLADSILAGAGGQAASSWHRQRAAYGEHGPPAARALGTARPQAPAQPAALP